jgi:hypothetical protein
MMSSNLLAQHLGQYRCVLVPGRRPPRDLQSIDPGQGENVFEIPAALRHTIGLGCICSNNSIRAMIRVH